MRDNEGTATDDREIAVGGDGKTPILDSVTGEPIRVPLLDFDPAATTQNTSRTQDAEIAAQS